MPPLLKDTLHLLEHRPAAYVLLGCDGAYLYKGSSRDLVERMHDHVAGRSLRTRSRRPLRLVHFEYCDDVTSAQKKERYLKSGHGRAWLKRHMDQSNG